MAMLVVAPIPQEFDVLTAAFGERWGAHQERDTGRTVVREYPAAAVALAQGGFGKAQFAATTQHLLDHLREVDLVVCAGVAGALTEAVRLGDVVIGTATLEHDFHSVILGGAPPRFEGSATHIDELARNDEIASGPFRVHFAPIASGDEGIIDARRRAEVHARTEALAVAYEGAGGARAAAFSQVPYLEVRGISDMANDDFLEHFEANLPSAMANVASIVARLAAG